MAVTLKNYYELAKPGMVYGNAVPLIAGFVLASHGHAILLLLLTLLGASLVIASGCVFNNYIDRGYDIRMERTKNRALVTGGISGAAALVYGTVLGAIGFSVLVVFTNLLAVAAAATGFLFYVFVYSLWFKRRSPWGAFVGAVAGATPPVIGYCAASGTFDAAAVILFLILFIWQMPHFYAIAIRRFDDYASAHYPVMPVVRGVPAAKIRMLLYCIVFVAVAPLLTVFGYAGSAYFIVSIILGLAWLGLCITGFSLSDKEKNIRWAKRMFLFSLVIMLVLFATIAVSSVV